MDSKLLDAFEELLRERFGDDVKVERFTNDTESTVTVKVYQAIPSFAKSVTFTKDLLDQYEDGALLA